MELSSLIIPALSATGGVVAAVGGLWIKRAVMGAQARQFDANAAATLVNAWEKLLKPLQEQVERLSAENKAQRIDMLDAEARTHTGLQRLQSEIDVCNADRDSLRKRIAALEP